ncbi:hypothetical protein N7512_005833 [Penicillium capsulatum]|nr:hypothetical protein N7512_005833 [Penicillium capsulatum]
MVRFGIISAVLVGTATASPAFLDPRSPPTNAKSTVSCTVDDTTSTQAVQKVLDSSGVNEWLDKKLETMHGEHDWVNKLWLDSFPNDGKSPLSGCGTVGSTCDPSVYCSDYPSSQAYWAFTAVSALHSKITYVHDKLLWKGWLDGLSIDQIGKDFSVPTPDFTWLKWVAAAFSMATGGATSLGVDQGIRAFTAASTYKPSGNTIDTASVKNTLKNIVGTVGDYTSDILANATGNGDANALPDLNQNTMFTHATAQFYEDNTILLDENKDNSSFVAAFDGFTKYIVRRLPLLYRLNIYLT